MANVAPFPSSLTSCH